METDDVAFDAARVVSSLDFGRLSRQQKAAMDDAQRDALDNEFTASIEEQQGALVKVLPNLKAVDQYQEAKVIHFKREIKALATKSLSPLSSHRHQMNASRDYEDLCSAVTVSTCVEHVPLLPRHLACSCSLE